MAKSALRYLSAVVMLLMLAAGGVPTAMAADYAQLPVVKPVISCTDMAKVRLDGVTDKSAAIDASATVETPHGAFCKITGTIDPAIKFEVDLPVAHWSQRYLEGGCGALCGMMPDGIGNASGCAPALNGEFALAGSDMGHQSDASAPMSAEFGADPQKRIDFAYRANHQTTLVAKTLIKAYYGRPAKYSYFVGCSDGGREALMEAQRYPEDFDGISAGDPAAMLTIQNSFAGAWRQHVNTRADGATILLAAKASLIHDAVITQCPSLSGVKDGLLQDPRACNFKPASLTCSDTATDTSQCLSAEEVAALEKLYEGAGDDQGHQYYFGYQRGAELQLHLPEAAREERGRGMGGGQGVVNLFLPIASPAEPGKPFEFTQANFARMAQFAPLYNATNTNLKPFAAHGGKLILWHGWSDTLIAPGISIAYYQGVQKFMGAAATDKFMKLFMLPGVGHCEGGDGYDQVDWLSPLMAWTELHHAPTQVIAGKSNLPEMPMMGPRGGKIVRTLYAKPAPALVAARPVYPYPFVAKYIGKGEANDAANYAPVKSPVTLPQAFGADAIRLIGPDNQLDYGVRDGTLVVLKR